MSGAAHERIRVAIVDDHPFVREWLTNLLKLEAAFVVVGEAEDTDSATMLVERLAPDVLIVDLSLKRGSGFEVIRLVRARHPSVRVLVLSTHEEPGTVEKAFRAGAHGYVMKSESTDQIVPAIHQVQAGKLYAAAHVMADLAARMLGRAPAREPPKGPPVSTLLSARELDVFQRLGDGQSTRRIAEELDVGQKTVQTYCARIKEKLGLDDGTSLLQTAAIWRDRQGD